MKPYTRYVCEFCDKIFYTAEEATAHEERHVPIVKIRKAEWESTIREQDTMKYPTWIHVKMDNGEIRQYKHHGVSWIK